MYLHIFLKLYNKQIPISLPILLHRFLNTIIACKKRLILIATFRPHRDPTGSPLDVEKQQLENALIM